MANEYLDMSNFVFVLKHRNLEERRYWAKENGNEGNHGPI